MIQVHVRRDHRGRIRHFSVRGHADFAQHGQDLLCAAISSLVQNGVNAPEALLGVRLPAISEDGLIESDVPELSGDLDDKVQLLLESMIYGIRSWAEEFPKHLRVIDKFPNKGGGDT
jgi:uncharacterized protein YsxB (DUF464 family)